VDDLEIRPPLVAEADATVALVLRAFDEFIAPDYSEEGIATFHAVITADSLVEAIHDGDIVLVGLVDGVLTGVVRVRDETHISWLYVDRQYQSRGIGRKLVRSAVAQIGARHPEAATITLHSSPFAVPIYQRMGFAVAGSETTKDGIRMTPMFATINALAR